MDEDLKRLVNCCPYCNSVAIRRRVKFKTEDHKYRCYNCGKIFNQVGTKLRGNPNGGRPKYLKMKEA